MIRGKAAYIHLETFDERGRYISYDEFKWILGKFRDRYDPRRLSFALAYTTGLRYHDAYTARLRWFNEDFTFMKMAQCKPHIRKKDGIIQITSKPKFVPLPDWLSEDLRAYVKYRLSLGCYMGDGIVQERLFPCLTKHNLRQFFQKLRDRHGHKEKWLMDVWKVVIAYNKEGKVIWKKPMFRVACHAGRANYCTAAYIASDKDLMKTKMLTGHEETKDVEKYIRVSNLMETKLKIKQEFMDGLDSKQPIPLLKGQRKLIDYG